MPRRLRYFAAALALAGAGCVNDPLSPDRPDPNTVNGGTAAGWPYWPVSMRIHPLSRLVRTENGAITVEARLEFQDRDGMTCRSFGEVRLEIHDENGPRRVDGDQRSWNVNIQDLKENAQRFDEVVRVYLFILKTDWEELPAEATLHAFFLGADGMNLKGELALRGWTP